MTGSATARPAIRLTVLGSGTCVPRPRRGPSGYAVEVAGRLLLMDGGSGTLDRLTEAGLDYRRIEAVLTTHTHPDHTLDLVALLFALNYTPGFDREEPLRIFGPAGFERFFRELEVPFPWIAPRGFELKLIEVASDRFDLDGIALRAEPVDHGDMTAVGYRLDADGASLVYTGDTRECESAVELARSADLLVADSSMPRDEEVFGAHMSAVGAGRLAAAAGVGALVLTHLYPGTEGCDLQVLAAETFSGRVIPAEDLLRIDLEAGTAPIVRRLRD